MTADPRFLNKQECQSLLDRLASIQPALVRTLEEEVVSPSNGALERLKHTGVNVRWDKH